MNLTDRLDRSFGDGPAHRPVHDRLIAGRRAVRRRRIVTGAASLSVTVVAGTVLAIVPPGGEPGTTSPSATQPSAPPSAAAPSLSPSTTPETDVAPDGVPAPPVLVALQSDGEVALADGVREIRRIDNPLEVSPPEYSVAIEVQRGNKVTWHLLHEDAQGGMEISDSAYAGFTTLQAWVDELLPAFEASSGPDDGAGDQFPAVDLELVELAPDGTLRPAREDVQIIEQRANPDLPDSFDGGRLGTAVAEVSTDGERYYVLARDREDPDCITVPAGAGGPTLAAFLDFARERYGSGVGLQ